MEFLITGQLILSDIIPVNAVNRRYPGQVQPYKVLRYIKHREAVYELHPIC